MPPTTTTGWAIKFRSENALDGAREDLCGRYWVPPPACPDHLAGYTTMIFATRQAAREYAKRHLGYIAERPDLQAEPHGWKPAQVVRVVVQIVEQS